jgi:purine-cytosine permease-like protein
MEDVEKQPASSPEISVVEEPVRKNRIIEKLEALGARFGVEARGIHRVQPEERHAPKNIQIALVWFSVALAAANMIIGMMGPKVFSLSFKDSALCLFFGNIVGALFPAYIAGFGPRSGNRTLSVTRYAFGWWPTKICAILQLSGTLGYGLLNVLITGQILAAVIMGGKMTVMVCAMAVTTITVSICGTGMRIFHIYQRYFFLWNRITVSRPLTNFSYAWLPQLAVFFVMVGCAGPNFDTVTPSSGTAAEIRGHRISFFFAVMNSSLIWSMCAADYFVYYPETTPRKTIGVLTFLGLSTATIFAEILGAGLAAGAVTNETWSATLALAPGVLLVEVFAPLGAFGKVCGVILALGPSTTPSNIFFCRFQAADKTEQSQTQYRESTPPPSPGRFSLERRKRCRGWPGLG